MSRLFCVCGPCWGNLQPSTNQLGLSGPLGGRGRQRGEGRREEEGEKGKGRDRKRRSGLSSSKTIPEGTHASIYY